MTVTQTETAVDERVRRGAAYLDEHGPDQWRDHIDLDRLDIGDGCDCVLGQLYGSFADGVGELSIGWDGRDLGFFGHESDDLTEAWRRELG